MGRSSEFANVAARSWPRCQPNSEFTTARATRTHLDLSKLIPLTKGSNSTFPHFHPVCTVTCLPPGHLCQNIVKIIATRKGGVGCKNCFCCHTHTPVKNNQNKATLPAVARCSKEDRLKPRRPPTCATPLKSARATPEKPSCRST